MSSNYIQEANYNTFVKYGIRMDKTTKKVAMYDVLNMINSNCYDMLKQLQNIKKKYPYIFCNCEEKTLEDGRSIWLMDIPNIILLIVSLNVNCNPELILDLITYVNQLKQPSEIELDMTLIDNYKSSNQSLKNELTLKNSEIKHLKKLNDENTMTYERIIEQYENEITVLKSKFSEYKDIVTKIQDKINIQLENRKNRHF